MKPFLNSTRIIVGVLFIFSGLIKANDPLGLSYKMQEFFEVWGWHGLNDYTLTLSLLMNAFEIIAGVAVLVGWRMKLFSWLLLLLIFFFTFLTAYALFSGKIKTCGCFGDCIPLTAQTSFIKDLLLLVLILLLFFNKNNINSRFSPSSSLLILVLATAFSFGIQWYVLKYLPVLDCLPYKKGNNIAEKMKIPAGAIPDSNVISFVYNKQGKEVEFTADKFPEDFNDSAYQFMRRYDKLVRKGNAEASVKDFILQTKEGNDTTQAILEHNGFTLLYFVRSLPTQLSRRDDLTGSLYRLSEKEGIDFFVVSPGLAAVDKYIISENNIPANRHLSCDFVAIKTAARANPTIYLLKQGTIMGKWSGADMDKAIRSIRIITSPKVVPAS